MPQGKKSKSQRTKITYESLNKWNFGLAALHAAQGIIILVLSSARAFPVTTNYLAIDPLQSKGAGHPVLALASRHLFDINLAYLIAAFFFISAIAHVLQATVCRPSYEADLVKGINKARWWDYALSASVMMIAIGLLVGVSDISTLLMFFGLIAIMNLLGLVMELYNHGKHASSWLVYWIGCLSGVLPWIAIAIYLIGSNLYGNGTPGFVYGIFGSIFVLFACFGLNMFLQCRKRGEWINYLYGERVYMILSLLAKTALAWQVFAGSLRP